MKLSQNVGCWFEIYVNDMARAKSFYRAVLNVDFEDAPPMEGMESMKMAFFPGDEKLPGASGALVEMEGARPEGEAPLSTMIYFNCVDCAVEQDRVEPAGGKVFQAKMPVGPHGYVAMCLDTEGNPFGLHSLE